jgi:hypothetical protein
MPKNNKIFILLLLSPTFITISRADTCSPPESSISPQLSSSVQYDKKLRSYKYQYSIKNEVTAQIPLDRFGFLVNEAPSSLKAPAYWGGAFTSLSSAPYDFVWSTFEPDPKVANIIPMDGSLAVPAYSVKPGKTLSGFEFTSANSPGVVQYFAAGFSQIPGSTPIPGNDEPEPSCPGWNWQNSQLENWISGAATGPADVGVTSVRIRAREETGLHECPPIDPKKANGKIAILVFSTQTFDASQIDLSDVVFGPAHAKPISSKLVPVGLGEKIAVDERLEWERILETLEPNIAGGKNSHPQNILLVFDVSALDVQCGLDQALFLRGETKTNQQFVGAVPAKVVGCGNKEIGKHKHHPFPFQWGHFGNSSN